MLPSQIAPDESLITRNYRYRPLTELKHAATILLPYYGDSGNWGLFGTTGFTEPLGKHMIAATGNLSFGNLRNSFRSEEHTSELQSRGHLVCRLLLEKTN